MLKKNYRYHLLCQMLTLFDDRTALRERAMAMAAKMAKGTKGLSEGHAPHLFDAMEILHGVWNEISEQAVKKCWRKTTLLDAELCELANETVDESTANDTTTNEEAVDATEGTIGEEDESTEVIDLISQFSKTNLMETPEYGYLNEFDEALLEMTNAVKETDPQNLVEMQKMVEGWVSIEDNEFCRDVIVAEVEELMDLDALCKPER